MLTKIFKSINLSRFLFISIALILLASACAENIEEPPPEATSSATLSATDGVDDQASPETPEGILEAAASRTPEPTPTPDLFSQQVDQLVSNLGLQQEKILGRSVRDWFDLGVSVLIVFFGSILLKWILGSLLNKLIQSTETDFDNRFLAQINRPLTWAIITVLIDFGIRRLGFIPAGVKSTLSDVFFILYLTFAGYVSFALVKSAGDWYHERAEIRMDPNQLAAIVVLITRVCYVFIGVIYISILLDHFGISITAVTAALGIGGLALSLGAQDTIADGIAGVIILIDQPFRIGDRIEIDGLDTWGDVTEIGLRTTRIRTRDNRLVVIPNSKIGNNAVVNYTYPDPNYRTQIELGIGYGNDIELVEEVIEAAVSKVDGLVPDKPVDVLFLEFGETNMTVRVRWWLNSYADTRYMFDRVNRAMLQAIDEAGITMPFTTYDVNINVDDENARRVSSAFRPSKN
jgi:small-conductance mechanosensitive channel